MSKTFILNPMKLEHSKKELTFTEKFREVGGNPGNLIFFESIKEQLNYEKEIYMNSYDPDELKNNTIVIPSSNFIMHTKNNPPLVGLIQKLLDTTNSSVTMVGLGAQLNKYFNTPKKLVKYGLSDEKLKLFKNIAERTNTIGVRGDITAECLELMGIKNYRVIGCPSFFNHLDGNFTKIKQPNLNGKIQMTITPGNYHKQKLYSFGIDQKCIHVVQSMSEYPRKSKISDKVVSPVWRLKVYPRLIKKSKDLFDYENKFSRVFFNIDEWNDFYKYENITFSFGTRFHGNMQSYRNGVPALWITHDSRTRELANYLHLPSIDIENLPSKLSMDYLLEKCNYNDTEKHYKNLCQNYVDFLNENNINHNYTI